MDVKPMCPFCGREILVPVFWDYFNKTWLACCRCNECDARWHTGYFAGATKEEAAEKACVASMHRPLQKPLTIQELVALIAAGEDIAVYCEAKGDDHAYATIFCNGKCIDLTGDMIDACDLVFFRYNISWRAWAQRPTDEERAAAPWEDAGNADL